MERGKDKLNDLMSTFLGRHGLAWPFRSRNENGFARAFGVMVVRVNAGGDAPPNPFSVGDVTGPPPFFVFSRKYFWRIKANEQDNIFGEGVKNYKKAHKTLTNKWRA